jgi:RNase P/RNase MRP subunit p30
MELEITIIKRGETFRAGKLLMNNKFFGYTIEDKDRGLTQSMSLEEISKIKVYGKTAIPTGRYEICMTYSNRFKRFMIQIMNVKGFDGIRMHIANSAKDVEGCVGVAYEDSSDGFAGNSAKAVEKLEKDIELALKKEKVWITMRLLL